MRRYYDENPEVDDSKRWFYIGRIMYWGMEVHAWERMYPDERGNWAALVNVDLYKEWTTNA